MNCPRCGAEIRNGAKFCGVCGGHVNQQLSASPITRPAVAATSTPRMPPAPPPLSPLPSPTDEITVSFPRQMGWGRSLLTWLKGLFHQQKQEAPTQVLARPGSAPSAMKVHNTRALKPEEEAISIFADRYVTMRHSLRSTFGFYEVYDVYCGHCGKQNAPGHGPQCLQCRQPLAVYLLYVSYVTRNPHLDAKDIVKLSLAHPLILDHISFWQEGERFVVMLTYPPGWMPVFRVAPMDDTKQIAGLGIQLGEALAFLHGRQVVHYALDTESVEGLVIQSGQLKLPDLTTTWALHLLPEEHIPVLLQRDIMFVAKVVYYLATAQMRPFARDSAFQGIFARAFNNQYATIGHLLDDLKAIQHGREVEVQISFSVGQANHAGKIRPANEDAAFVLPMMRLHESQSLATALCIVADGMGGQDAGERASKMAYKIIAAEINSQLIMPALEGEVTRRLYSSSGEVLKEAIEKANQRVYEIARQQGTNMGTTVTAALLEGPRAYIANVGDSRTYRLRNGALEKLTEDHSLVGRLVQAGAISPEEVYTHPQRNQIYRSLGDKPTIEVDLVTTDLRKGDQLILCSDGLWEMVRDPQIRDILLRSQTPQGAAETLVRAAYDAGGEDNITVVLVYVQ